MLGAMSKFRPNSLRKKSFHMLTLNKPFWSKDQNDLCKEGSIRNDFFGTNLDEIWTWSLMYLFAVYLFIYFVDFVASQCFS